MRMRRWSFHRGVRVRVWLGVVVGLACVVRAQTYRYVSPAGDGSDGLSWATARTNLQTAVDDAVSGDVICVRTGIYTLAGAVVVSGKNITIRGGYRGETPEPGAWDINPSAAILDGNAVGRVLVLTNMTDGLIENLTLRNGLFADHGGGVYAAYATNVFRYCVIRDNVMNGSEKQGCGVYLLGTSTRFDRCILKNNLLGPSGGTRYGGALAMGGNGSQLVMQDCEIIGNEARYNGAMTLAGTGNAILSNCLIRCNWDSGTWGIIRTAKTATWLIFCTVADNSTGGSGVERTGGNVYITNSIVWNNGVELMGPNIYPSYSCIKDPVSGPGILASDPRFVGDYFLADDSPCLNAGAVSALSAGVGGLYAATNTPDTGLADLGYHRFLPFSIEAPDLYVSANAGNDANPGTTPLQPFKTISRALAVAEPGARIHVAAGVYNRANGETFPVKIGSAPLELCGEGAETTILDATGAGTRVAEFESSGRSTRIQDLTFMGGSNVTAGGGLYLRGTSARFERVVIRNNLLNVSEQHGGGLYLVSGLPVFTECHFISNRHTRGTTYGGGAELYGRPRFERCVFFRNSCSYWGGAMVFSGYRLEMDNCVIVSNDSANTLLIADGIQHTAGQGFLNHLTIAGNEGRGLVRSGGTCVISNSILWANGVDTTGGVSAAWCSISNGWFTDGGNNTNIPPLFAAWPWCHLSSRAGHYTGGYFSGGSWERGTAQSPLIDAADPATPFGQEPQPNGGRANLGAYGNTPVASKTWRPGGTLMEIR